MRIIIGMAANQKSQDIDVLSVRKIFAKGDNNTTLAANSILATDGQGGTQWVDMSTIQAGVTFNTFVTTPSTFTSGPYSSRFSILDGVNAGLTPASSGNTVTMYAKAFGQIDVPGQSSINSFNTYTGQINSNVTFIGSGVANILTDTSINKIQFYTPDTGLSSISSVLANFKGLNNSLSNTIGSFNSPFSTFIYSAISSFSTSLGNSSNTYFNKVNTSSLQILGQNQPFIQYGYNVLDTGTRQISLTTGYIDTNYIVQLTYNGNGSNSIPLSFTIIDTATFIVYGDSIGSFHWTTYGNLF